MKGETRSSVVYECLGEVESRLGREQGGEMLAIVPLMALASSSKNKSWPRNPTVPLPYPAFQHVRKEGMYKRKCDPFRILCCLLLNIISRQSMLSWHNISREEA